MKNYMLIMMFLILLPKISFAWCNDCGGGDCCGCPGEAQCLGSYSSCEEACGLSSGPSYSPPVRDYEGEAGNALNDQGIVEWKNGNVEAAINFYTQALQKKPYDTMIHQNLAHAVNELGNRAWKAGDVSKAINYYTQALEDSPDDAVIRDNLNRSRQDLEQRQAKARAEEQQRLEYIERAKIQTVEIKKVAEGFSLDKGSPSGRASLGVGASVGDAFNTHKAAPVLEFGNPSEDLSEKAREWFNKLGATIESAKPVSAERLAAINNDPRMVATDREIARLKQDQDNIDRDVILLASQASAVIDPVRKNELNAAIEQKKQEKNVKTVVIAQVEETKKKLHRTINTEIEQKK